MSEPGSEELPRQVVTAIRLVQERIRWKAGKDVAHLATRIEYGHLSRSATLAEYETIITSIVQSETAEVYIYRWKQDVYPTIVQNHGRHRWLVMFNLAGIMETAFPPTDPDEYLADPRFQRMGTIQELIL